MKVALRYILTLSLLAVSACSGRIDDQNQKKSVDLQRWGLTEGKPALLVFGALWCKPCREEIPMLNRAAREYADRLQIQEFLVEGVTEGTIALESDRGQFLSKEGIAPIYPMMVDPNWTIFSELAPPRRALPTVAFISSGGEVLRFVQRSLEYADELKPMLDSLVSGTLQPVLEPEPSPGDEEPTPDPSATPTPGGSRISVVSDWSAMNPEQAPGTEFYARVEAAYQTGLDKFSFPASSMPFLTGKLTEKWNAATNAFELSSGLWKSPSCRLTVTMQKDGTYIRSTGVCF